MHPSRLGGLLPTQPQQDTLPALDSGTKTRPRRKRGVAVVVTIIRVGKELDSDNLQSACKGLRDGIADTLGVDDRDPRVRWEYAQTESTKGRTGCIVKVELL